MKYLLSIALAAYALTFISCGGPSVDSTMHQQQAKLNAEAAREVGMPGITNFTEKKIVRRLYELRDQNVSTYAYVADLNGNLHFVCDSLGFGLPYGVQFSNPEYITYYGGNMTKLPQAEPNGLYMPPTAEGTWVICADHADHSNFKPVYIEPRVVVSPFKLKAVDNWQPVEKEEQ